MSPFSKLKTEVLLRKEWLELGMWLATDKAHNAGQSVGPKMKMQTKRPNPVIRAEKLNQF